MSVNGCSRRPPAFDGFAELNAWLAQRCEELAYRPHPAQASRTIAACFAEEQSSLIPITARFDGHVDDMRRVGCQCLVSADRNRYSVPATWANQVVSGPSLRRPNTHRGQR